MKQITFIEENKKKYLLENNPTAPTLKVRLRYIKKENQLDRLFLLLMHLFINYQRKLAEY